MIRVTEVEQELAGIRDVVTRVYPLFDRHNQISITSRPDSDDPIYDAVGWLPDGAREADYSMVTEPFRGTAVEALLRKLPFRYGRTRLMRMRPKSCLSIHADPTPRYHYAITTNPGCFIVGIGDGAGTFHHIPADGRLYEMDAHRTHTAMNSGKEDRVHLVICPADPTRPSDSAPIGRVTSAADVAS